MSKRTRQTGAGGPAEGTIVTAELVSSTDPADQGAWLVYKASAEAELARLRNIVTTMAVVRDSQAASQKQGVASLRLLTQEKNRLQLNNEHLTSVNVELRADVKRRKRQAAKAVTALME